MNALPDSVGTEERPYPNAPVREVVFEFRFPGEPAVESHRDEFFERARAEFPEVHVPRVQLGQAVALSPYHFRTADGQKSLMTALNSFAFVTNSYPGYARFKEEALKWVREFGKMFKINRLTRTGLRYVNLIPYPPGSGLPITHFLLLNLGLGSVEPQQFENLALAATIPAGAGSVTIHLAKATGDKGEEGILLDFDFAKTEGLSFSEIETYLDESHTETKKLFEGLITADYRRYLLGKELVA